MFFVQWLGTSSDYFTRRLAYRIRRSENAIASEYQLTNLSNCPNDELNASEEHEPVISTRRLILLYSLEQLLFGTMHEMRN
jgi:hypothetical protein